MRVLLTAALGLAAAVTARTTNHVQTNDAVEVFESLRGVPEGWVRVRSPEASQRLQFRIAVTQVRRAARRFLFCVTRGHVLDQLFPPFGGLEGLAEITLECFFWWDELVESLKTSDGKYILGYMVLRSTWTSFTEGRAWNGRRLFGSEHTAAVFSNSLGSEPSLTENGYSQIKVSSSRH